MGSSPVVLLKWVLTNRSRCVRMCVAMVFPSFWYDEASGWTGSMEYVTKLKVRSGREMRGS